MKEQMTQSLLWVKTPKAHKGDALTHTYTKDPIIKGPWGMCQALLATRQTPAKMNGNTMKREERETLTMGSLARPPAAEDHLRAKDPQCWGQKEVNPTVCPQGLPHSARESKPTCPRGDGTGGTRPGRGGGARGTLGHSRQLASSVWSSQSESPSQRHSLRTQCPFPQGNSLGSQGGVGPECTERGSARGPPPAAPLFPVPPISTPALSSPQSSSSLPSLQSSCPSQT